MKKSEGKSWHLYVLQCGDGSYYTGITTDVSRRVAMHNRGRAAKYTSGRRPVRLVYEEVAGSRSEALKKEERFKKQTRAMKTAQIRKHGRDGS